MARHCKRCGCYARDAEPGPDATCPRCGTNYVRAAMIASGELMRQEASIAGAPTRSSRHRLLDIAGKWLRLRRKHNESPR